MSELGRARDEELSKIAKRDSDQKRTNDNLQKEIDGLLAVKAKFDEQICQLEREIDELTPANDEVGGEFTSKFSEDFIAHAVLGEGGFGCVFEAENRYDGWKYALKRVAVDSSKTTKQQALGEVRAMAQLDHPGIVRYNSTWLEEPPAGWQYEEDAKMLEQMNSPEKHLKTFYSNDSVFIYIQMQRCLYSLTSWLEEHKTRESRELEKMKKWFKQIVSAVAYIHKKNLIHRDLKPSNILFVDANTLKVCDLGIATQRRLEDGVETAITRTNIGTQLYMSPEQGDSFFPKYSSKTDVFALGLILAELSCPMYKEARSKIFDNYRRGKQFDKISDKRTNDFISKLTTVDPKHRFSCVDMLNHLYLS